MSIQERFQTVLPYYKQNKKEVGWVTPQSQRVVSNVDRRGMPVGYDASPSDQFTKTLAGNPDAASLQTGFTSLPMSPIAEVYSGEQTDLFYGEVHSDDGKITGFAERNNYLDSI